jgi:ABC-type Zn uptake system ZnuABC Zn-binding protein ZnuA
MNRKRRCLPQPGRTIALLFPLLLFFLLPDHTLGGGGPVIADVPPLADLAARIAGGDEKATAAIGRIPLADLEAGFEAADPSGPEETERKIFAAALGIDGPPPGGSGSLTAWLDPLIARGMVDRMEAAAATAVPGRANLFNRNAARLRERLAALDVEIRQLFENVPQRRFAVFPGSWSAFARRYRLEEIPLAGVTPGGGPGRQSLKGTVSRIRSLGVGAVFTDRFFPREPAAMAARRAGVPLLVLSPFGAGNKVGYFEMMRYNADVIERGLRLGVRP